MQPRTDWQETVAPDENERFERYAQRLGELQRKKAAGGSTRRALHNKQHVGARAELEVLGDLPPEYRVGIFAAPGRYDAVARFSNGNSGRQSDHKGDIRGIALKVLGVPGKKIIPGLEDARTQDFLMIQTPSVGFKNTDDFLFFAFAAESPLTLLFKLFGRFGFGSTLQLLKGFAAVAGKPVPSMAALRVWSALPIKWGDYAAKFSAIPKLSLDGKMKPGPDALGEDLRDRLAQGPIEYDFAVQLYTDAARTPIEDASVEWREEDAPFVRVARLRIHQQDLRSPEGQKLQEHVEKLSFDPWHAPVEFRPLGDMMRARNHAYRVSGQNRGAASEPESLAAITAANR